MKNFWSYLTIIVSTWMIQRSATNPIVNINQCQRSVTYEEMQYLLIHSPCAMEADEPNYQTDRSKRRRRNRANTDSSNHVYALQATMNDHRTIIDDHRTMINYLMNNTVNVTQLNQHFIDHHSKTGPIWKSWRDMSIIFLITLCLSMLIYVAVIHIRPLELLTSFLLRRHQAKEEQVKVTQKKNSMVRGHHSDLELDYLRY